VFHSLFYLADNIWSCGRSVLTAASLHGSGVWSCGRSVLTAASLHGSGEILYDTHKQALGTETGSNGFASITRQSRGWIYNIQRPYSLRQRTRVCHVFDSRFPPHSPYKGLSTKHTTSGNRPSSEASEAEPQTMSNSWKKNSTRSNHTTTELWQTNKPITVASVATRRCSLSGM
jgi:hypothetical protein